MPLQLILTRPQAQQSDWLQRLQALGVQALSLPLIEIGIGRDPGAAARGWAHITDARLLMFVSPNAVSAFFAARPAGVSWPAGVLAATVGPGSAQALLAHGVPAEQIIQPPPDSPSLDSEHLWPLLSGRAWQGQRAWIVRGEGGREWLADRLREAGARVEALHVYARQCPRLRPTEQALLTRALASPCDHVWLFSSSEAVGHLRTLSGAAADWSASLAIATHERIAATASAAGFGHVVLARPDAAAVAQALHALESAPLQSSAP